MAAKKPPVSQFANLKALRDRKPEDAPVTPPPSPETPTAPEPPTPPIGKRMGRPKGKRSNPDFEQTTLFLRKDTKRATMQLLEEEDLSELVERLLAGWAKNPT